ncbi:NEL-type E3 ubiquitin ligase domain-containing protein [Sphingomonas sp. NCPPB 2930]
MPNDPGPTDFALLWTRLMQEPELASRLARVFGGMLGHANTEAPERNFDFPFSVNQFIVLRGLLSGLDGLRQLAHQVLPAAEQNIGPQQRPLGTEIQIWSELTGVPIDPADAFDHDENAAPFAEVLAAMRTELQMEPETSERTMADVSAMLHAIAADAELRSEVFSLARDALGSCRDNLDEGFSRMVLAVDNHRMVQAVRSGEVDAKRLDDWAGSLFRLSLLETAVSRHIASRLRDASSLSAQDRANLTEEPLETMVHAKVALRGLLQLPTSTVFMMQHRQYSVLGPNALESLRREVQLQAQDVGTRCNFLLGHPTWRAGIQALYPQEFQDLKSRQDEDPFYDLDLPAATDLAEQAAYAERALQVHNRHAQEERALMLRLAAACAGPQETAAESSHSG